MALYQKVAFSGLGSFGASCCDIYPASPPASSSSSPTINMIGPGDTSGSTALTTADQSGATGLQAGLFGFASNLPWWVWLLIGSSVGYMVARSDRRRARED